MLNNAVYFQESWEKDEGVFREAISTYASFIDHSNHRSDARSQSFFPDLNANLCRDCGSLAQKNLECQNVSFMFLNITKSNHLRRLLAMNLFDKCFALLDDLERGSRVFDVSSYRLEHTPIAPVSHGDFTFRRRVVCVSIL